MRREGAWAVSGLSRFAGTLLIGLLAANCDDPNRGPPTRYSYFDAVVEFTAEGQRLKAETTVQCMTPGGLTPGHRPLHPTPSHPFVTKRLPSGAGVMFVVSMCSGGRPPSPDAIPVAYWLDDVNHPTVLEKYISVSAFGPGNPIERIHSFHVTEKYGSGTVPRPYSDPTVEIPWLNSRKRGNPHKIQEGWLGYFVTFVPKELWTRHKAFAKKLEGQQGIVRLPGTEVPEKLIRSLLARYHDRRGPILPQRQSANGAPDSPYRVSLWTRTVLLKPERSWAPDSEYHVSFRPGWPSGKIVLRPVISSHPDNQHIGLLVDGILIEGPFGPPYFYDSRAEILFHVFPETFVWGGLDN